MDTKRLYGSLSQEAKKLGKEADIKEIIDVTQEVALRCGEASQNRKMAARIGSILLRSELAPVILAPSCPDYTHEDGRYTFEDIGGGVSYLADQQIGFLTGMQEVLPNARMQILIADQEAEDAKIAAACGKTADEFRDLIAQSVKSTDAVLGGKNWTALPMTDAISDFYENERENIRILTTDESLQRRLEEESRQRAPLYQSIDPTIGSGEMRERTIRTAAQYRTVGEFAVKSGYLISNHTTTNLGWYNDAGAAVLHNPLKLY